MKRFSKPSCKHVKQMVAVKAFRKIEYEYPPLHRREEQRPRAVVEYSGFQPQRTEELPAKHKAYLDTVPGMHPLNDLPGNENDGTNLPNQKPVDGLPSSACEDTLPSRGA